MFSYVEETEEGTVLYQVRTYRWCMCWAFFNASEVFERASEILCPWDNRSPPNGCIQ